MKNIYKDLILVLPLFLAACSSGILEKDYSASSCSSVRSPNQVALSTAQSRG